MNDDSTVSLIVTWGSLSKLTKAIFHWHKGFGQTLLLATKTVVEVNYTVPTYQVQTNTAMTEDELKQIQYPTA